jgi:hypothetical protein
MFAGSSFGNYAAYAAEILVLFETPSGFAVFSMKEYYLNQQDAMKVLFALSYLPCSITHVLAFLSLSLSSA